MATFQASATSNCISTVTPVKLFSCIHTPVVSTPLRQFWIRMDSNNVKCLKCQISCKICSRTMKKGSLKRHMKVHAKQLNIENNNTYDYNDGQANLYETYQVIITSKSPKTTSEKKEKDIDDVYTIYKLIPRLDREDDM